MEFKNFTYLILLIASISIPLIQSFDKRKQYAQKIKYILPAILITAVFFLIWDIHFTQTKIWSFNTEYTLGKNINGLPIEEWLFFLVVPYCCIFIYEIVKVDLEKYEYPNFFLAFSLVLIIGFGLISYFYRQRLYTFLAFMIPSVYLAYTIFRNRFRQYLTKFYFSYFISLIPLLIVYGILASLPLVEYNPSHILNIRILNIPVEDFSYFFLMLLMAITIYEFLKEKRYY
ncbi:MAG TPA: lycopene cyclase domain-containing protein [Prolixibacteraceae bacterium]|jgi:lycopene cyclase domain-containing protein|nr:lycopene cyclase domain-containing protein [Prolixibacteraceae bacterium]